MVETEDVEGGGDEATPMGKLSETQIEKGQKVLKEIRHVMGEEEGEGTNSANSKSKAKSKKLDLLFDDMQEQLQLLSSEFYSLIPSDFGRKKPPCIDNLELLQEKEVLIMRMGGTYSYTRTPLLLEIVIGNLETLKNN